MRRLAADGKYTISKEELSVINSHFVGYYSSEEDTKKTIKNTYEKKNCLIDTHTAVAINATDLYMSEYKAERKILSVSTASPYKFARDVFVSLFNEEPLDELSALTELSEKTGTDIPYPLSGLALKKVLHDEIIDKDDMEDATLKLASL
jgi:threonine synthase